MTDGLSYQRTDGHNILTLKKKHLKKNFDNPILASKQ